MVVCDICKSEEASMTINNTHLCEYCYNRLLTIVRYLKEYPEFEKLAKRAFEERKKESKKGGKKKRKKKTMKGVMGSLVEGVGDKEEQEQRISQFLLKKQLEQIERLEEWKKKGIVEQCELCGRWRMDVKFRKFFNAKLCKECYHAVTQEYMDKMQI